MGGEAASSHDHDHDHNQDEALEAMLASLGLDVALEDLGDDGLRERVIGLRRVMDRIEAHLAQCAHALQVRAIPAADATVDASAWLVRHTSMSRRAARAVTSLGAAMASSAVVGPSVLAGQISPEAARLVLGARNSRTAEAWDRDESLLVHYAVIHNPDELRAVMRHWSAAADPDGVDPGTDRDRNQLSMPTVGGRGVLRGDFDAESTAIINQALADMVDELWRAAGDGARGRHSAAWWRAEALVEIVRRSGAVEDPDSARPARPLVTVVVDYDALVAPRGRLVGLPTGELVSAEAVRRMACDAGLARVVTRGTSVPLDAGRARRIPSPAQYRAVLVRDRGCAIRGCAAPPWMCEVHHRRHWADGGGTDIDNLVMVCRREHRLAHEGGFEVQAHPDGGFHLVRRQARAAA